MTDRPLVIKDFGSSTAYFRPRAFVLSDEIALRFFLVMGAGRRDELARDYKRLFLEGDRPVRRRQDIVTKREWKRAARTLRKIIEDGGE